MELTVAIRHEADGCWAQVRELPGCFASGRTLNELREALGEAVGLYLWDEPASVVVAEPLQVGEARVQAERTARG